MEEWRDIPGYEGYYQVSDKGRLRSCDRTVPNRWGNGQPRKGKVMRPGSNPGGYVIAVLQRDSVVKYLSLHRVVADVFIPNPEEKPQINHIDGDKKNNCVNNLEWCNAKENIQHAQATGLLQVKGEQNPNAKLTVDQVLEIRGDTGTTKSIALSFDVSCATVKNIKARRVWKSVP